MLHKMVEIAVWAKMLCEVIREKFMPVLFSTMVRIRYCNVIGFYVNGCKCMRNDHIFLSQGWFTVYTVLKTY